MRRKALLLSLGMLAAGLVQAADVSFEVGNSSESTTTVRLGTQFDFATQWYQSDTGHLGGYWDLGYTYWDGDDASSNHTLSFSPVLLYEFAGESLRPYVEAGIGVAAFADTRLEEQKLGSSFQFEDRLGVGLRFGEGHDVGLRIYHYSNAGIKDPNDGVEHYSLRYRLSF
ncbi:acyloxyacyl hydrolase [Atopomonas sediminilitoris]|uniref:acyloxyacyl hydrolase n=1 Tax=Atopomonas sediminilitoris TaxID=2919919 RepID=UPI001F4E31AA|nr:acyloxyacyl hydrolase [Atopomonas sediminilitoris]MCJ8169634.1 acyloxyacyl hydrolase [Atopomonas sediminilitoris]